MNNLDYPLPVLELVAALKQLPGIGTRGAERMALWMLQGHMGEAESIARTIGQAADSVTPCPVCGFFSTAEAPCEACRDEERDARTICVVEQATDVIPIERSSAYRGLYHCLGGKLSPLDDVEPEDLNIRSLVERVENILHQEPYESIRGFCRQEYTKEAQESAGFVEKEEEQE